RPSFYPIDSPLGVVAAMNAKQMAILIATVMAVVVVVTVVKVGMGGRGGPKRQSKSDDVILNKPHLAVANPNGPSPPPFVETGRDGHHDFWFTNENDVPVEVFLTRVSCNRCVSLHVGLAPEDWQAAQAAQAATVVGLGPAASLGPAQQAAKPAPVPGAD